MENYETLAEAITALRKQGYTEDFNLHDDCIDCPSRGRNLQHHEFSIDKSFRFDVAEDPADQAVVYAISSNDQQLKGVLVNGYGVYSDTIANELLEKLS